MRLILIISLFLAGCVAKEKSIATQNIVDEGQGSDEQSSKTRGPEGETVLMTTRLGEVEILVYDETPLHQANFLKLVDEEFYNDLLFHRVINHFMIQGGDPKSLDAEPGARLGGGGPGYTVPAEFNPKFVHKKGALAAARTNNPEKASSGSQFYIVHGKTLNDQDLNSTEARISQKNPGFTYSDDQRVEYIENGGVPFLDMDYTVFGEVISGFEVIDAIAKEATAPGDRPIQDVKMSIKRVN